MTMTNSINDKAADEIGPARVIPEWEKKPVVFPSTQSTGRGKITHSAVNWPKVDPVTQTGRLETIYRAWQDADKFTATKYVSWDDISKATGLPVEELAAELKYLHQQHPEDVAFTVDRMGHNTYFKFKKSPAIAPVAQVKGEHSVTVLP